MTEHIILFAATPPAEDGNLFAALGIEWELLIFQILGFLVLVFLLGKFVYPWLMKQVDERQANIEAAAEAATQAQKSAEESQEKTAELLNGARKEAAEIVATAKLESAAMLSESEAKAKAQAERLISEAHARIEKDIATAKKELYNETLQLVALATEKVTAGALTVKADDARIEKALKGSK